MTDALGYLVAQADKRLQQLVALEMRALRVTPQQFWVLLLLYQGALKSVGEVGERIGIDRPASSRLVMELQRRGWVRLDPPRERRRPVELTARGKQQAERFRMVAAKLAAAMEEGVQQRQVVAEGLMKMISNLDQAIRGRRSRSRS